MNYVHTNISADAITGHGAVSICRASGHAVQMARFFPVDQAAAASMNTCLFIDVCNITKVEEGSAVYHLSQGGSSCCSMCMLHVALQHLRFKWCCTAWRIAPRITLVRYQNIAGQQFWLQWSGMSAQACGPREHASRWQRLSPLDAYDTT
jgi:hypothetical protein